MNVTKKVSDIIYPTLVVIIYLVSLYFLIAFEWHKGLLISVNDITPSNYGNRLLSDSISSLLPVIIILAFTIMRKRKIKDLGVTLESPFIIGSLFLIYLVMFFVNRDFTVRGYYLAFFYLIVVAFSEEFIFRGYLFGTIDREVGFRMAAVISGILFGAAHSIMPAIIHDYTPLEITSSILSNLLGQGILMGGVFAWLYKKSRTLFVPVLIHAILDYSGVLFSK